MKSEISSTIQITLQNESGYREEAVEIRRTGTYMELNYLSLDKRGFVQNRTGWFSFPNREIPNLIKALQIYYNSLEK